MRIFKDISKPKYIVKLLFLLLSQCGKVELKLKSRLYFNHFFFIAWIKSLAFPLRKANLCIVYQ